MDPEAAKSADHRKELSWKATVLLAFQSLGVAYGDLSISPLYVYKTTFAEDIRHSRTNIEIYGVLSFVFWTLTLVPLFKYAFIVLRADDNGEGGTFALYSLICRHANVSLLPNKQLADEELSTYIIEPPPDRGTNSRIKIWLEKHKKLHVVLLIVVMLGTGMVIGDGVLTPTLSVFSAVSGLELLVSSHQHEYTVVPVTCFILICLFALQHYGTHRVSFLFAPIILTWLICISGLGIYNIARWNPGIIQALSPYYMYKFLKKTKKSGWMSLGGILLCITGSEAMFADLGHFSYSSMQIAFTFVVYPALILAYMGQAAYLSKHHMIDPDYKIGFYVYVPEVVRWPVFLLAVVAAIVGSQAIISCTFSIINQSHALGCFPRVKVIHTSDKISGQIYIPEINWMLMILCVAVAVGFRNLKHVGNAQGLALMTVMLVTTWLTSVVVVVCWKRPPLLALSFLVFFSAIEGFYFSACLTKFLDGAWLPILLAVLLMTVMFVWHYATSKKYEHDVHNKVSLEWLLALGENIGAARVPGIGLVYTDLISGIPSSFSRFITNLPAYHRILVFVCIKYIPVPFVPPAERYLVGRVGPIKHRSYRCIVRYGYRDVHQDVNSFEDELTASLADFIRVDAASGGFSGEGEDEADGGLAVIGSSFCTEEADEGSHTRSVSLELTEAMPPTKARKVRFLIEEGSSSSSNSSRPRMADETREELEDLQEACEAGTAFILGHSYVKTKPGSPVLKKLVLDIGYNFLKRNCRGPEVALRVPPASLLEVGMVYIL